MSDTHVSQASRGVCDDSGRSVGSLEPDVASRSTVPLHRDVLHCVFAFLGHSTHHVRSHGGAREYASVASVCRSWRDAVSSAPVGRVALVAREVGSLSRMMASPLRRCVGSLDVGSYGKTLSFTTHFRRELAAAMPHLRHMSVHLIGICSTGNHDSGGVDDPDDTPLPPSLFDSGWPLYLPLRLESLHLWFDADSAEGRHRHSEIDFARLTRTTQCLADSLADTLTTLRLHIVGHSSESALSNRFAWMSPLRALTRLTSLAIHGPDQPVVPWPEEAIDVLRGLTNLTYLDCLGSEASNWSRLTAAPFALQVREFVMPRLFIDSIESITLPEYLSRLTTLTKLDTTWLAFKNDATSSLLSRLPALRDLRWANSQPRPSVAGLRTFTQMRTLTITHTRVTDRQMCTVIPVMTHLEKLMLMNMPLLRSLHFLSAPQLPSTLVELHLTDVHLPDDDFLSHSCPVRSLQSLQTIVMYRCVTRSDLTRRVHPLVDAASPEFIGRHCWPDLRSAILLTPYFEKSHRGEYLDPIHDEEEERVR